MNGLNATVVPGGGIDEGLRIPHALDTTMSAGDDPLSGEYLHPGEIVTFRFRASNTRWVRAWQAGQIEKRLDRHAEDFYVWSVDYWQEGLLVFKIRIKGDTSKLWTEVRIAGLISQVNPTGYKLAFIESWRDFKEDILAPAVTAVSDVLTWVLVGAGLYLLLREKK